MHSKGFIIDLPKFFLGKIIEFIQLNLKESFFFCSSDNTRLQKTRKAFGKYGDYVEDHVNSIMAKTSSSTASGL